MRWMGLVLTTTLVAVSLADEPNEPQFLFPVIKNYGGVAALPQAAEPPRAGAKVIFDIAGEGKPGEVHPGLERVARYLNLHGLAGQRPDEVTIALVLHGGATKAALRDGDYAEETHAARNPNLELLRQLQAAGVELFVCGQSLARSGYRIEQAAPELTVAVSAMTVTVNKQLDGFAYLPVH
jgi:intracellular sulfur oxidation DsrE/DsrF family protein